MTTDGNTTLTAPSALLHPQWWAWNEQVWGVEAVELSLQHERVAGAVLAGALFRDRRGRVVTPPMNPHLPIVYSPAGLRAKRLDTQSRAWVSIGDQLAEVLTAGRLANAVVLPPGLLDARPFTWNGLRAGLSYTYVVDLPRNASLANSSVAKNIRKSVSRGHRASRSDDWAAILSCLEETEISKGFSHRLSLDDLKRGARLMGPDHFRGYVVRDSSGRVVSGGIRLHHEGHRAVDWVQGTTRRVLADGVNQLMYDYVMRDLHEAGAMGFDLAGANIREVALAKSSWGYPLAPQVTLEAAGLLREARQSIARNPRAARAIDHGRKVAARLPNGRAKQEGCER